MTPKQIAYVARRRSQIRYWPWLGLLLVLLLAAGYGWLWQHAPININPFLVLDQFGHKTLSDEELILLAARGSLALVTCGLFLLVIILLISVALLNESRLIRMLDELTAGGALPAEEGPAVTEDAGPGPAADAAGASVAASDAAGAPEVARVPAAAAGGGEGSGPPSPHG